MITSEVTHSHTQARSWCGVFCGKKKKRKQRKVKYFHHGGQSGTGGYCNSMKCYDILLTLTTGMLLKSAIMS